MSSHRKRKFYAVKIGRGGPAIYETWPEASRSPSPSLPSLPFVYPVSREGVRKVSVRDHQIYLTHRNTNRSLDSLEPNTGASHRSKKQRTGLACPGASRLPELQPVVCGVSVVLHEGVAHIGS
jgi:hypothetical protein